MTLSGLLDVRELAAMIEQGYVRVHRHPSEPLRILNYTERATYARAWNPTTRACRGLIVDDADRVVARPFPKFFNYGEPDAAALELDAVVVATEKMDGSLGILYPASDGLAIATRGSFTSGQALHATELLRARYPGFQPRPATTYLFEIVYPGNRVVLDYGDMDDLVLLDIVPLDPRAPVQSMWLDARPHGWPGPVVEAHPHRTLADALAAEQRPQCEGLVVFFPASGERLKIKQDDYVALHRILTGTNARNVWEVAAVHACRHFVREPKRWAEKLQLDPERARQVLELGDAWLADVPDEFHGWVREVTERAEAEVKQLIQDVRPLAEQARALPERRLRYELVREHPLAPAIMRLAHAETEEERARAEEDAVLRAWLAVRPEPTAPFARSEDVA